GHADAVAHAGGAWDEGDGAGLWRLSVSLTSLADDWVGGRLAKTP
ncbi:hypothetical protein HNR56_004213, partial [Roseospira marina]|nr:hypothetical protein [Roseospira marina]MBB5089484.1 hypothetical protein [Roseospira marina]